jgi:predicted AlkP superfamily pyrophosphatase or phosphodiesterase
LKSSIATLSLLSTLCLPQLQAQAISAATAKAVQHPPRLVVAIIVDQFRFDYTTRFASRYTGGLHTMLAGGAVFVDAHQDHYPTVTATGHATFMTGSTPATSGIIGNEWFDRAQGRSITSVEDAGTKLLGGKPGATGSSPHNLIVSTLGDELKIADHNTTRVIGISMKDRAAILPAGRMADAAYWIDDTTGAFVSSTWYQPSLPSWVESFNETRPAQSFLGYSWFAPGAEQKGAKPFVTLPRDAGKVYIGAFETTPWSNEMLENFAEQAIRHEELGHHNGTDLLTISFSANDHLGHAVGPDDAAVEELAVRTDKTIGKLIAAAERQVGGSQNLVVVMSADHGVAPVPELSVARRMPGGRVDKAAYTRTVQDALDSRFGKAHWIIGSWESGFYFDQNLIRERKLNPSDVEDEAARAIADLPCVERTYTRTQLMHRQAMASLADDYVARSFFPSRGPDLFVIFKPYWLFGKEGTSHGSPWDYDTHVPLLFFGAGIQPGTYAERVDISDVAPTLAALLHVETPSGSVGHILPEIVSPSRLPSSATSPRSH